MDDPLTTPSIDLKGRRILAVDDDRINLRIIGGILRHEGYEIIEAQPRYGVGDREAPSRQRAGERKGDGTSPPAGGRVKGQGTDRHSKMKLPFRWEGLGLLRNDANI